VIRLVIFGTPHPQGSKSAMRNKHTGRINMIEGSKTGAVKHKEWRRAVADAARDHLAQGGEIVPDGPVGVWLVFHLAKPKSTPKYQRWVRVKPDLDKLIRAVLDGLADGGALVGGDSRVAEIKARKVYATPGEPTGCLVLIWSADDDDVALYVPTMREDVA